MSEHKTVPRADRKPPKAGTPVNVDVYISSPVGGLRFRHKWRWEDGTPGGEDRIDIPAREKHEGGTPIHFHVHDETVPKRGFDFDEANPMCVSRTGCPPKDQTSEDREVPRSKMKAGNKQLKVFNENNDDCTLHYRLRFLDSQGRAESYDPDIKNGGTNRL